MTVDTTKLPLADSNFRDLRLNDRIYVDKTEMVNRLARSSAPIFLSRPRRFGKSLLVSTFKSLFSRGLEDFRGLEIEKLWKEEKTYPVIHLDCSGMERSTFEEFEKVFNEKLALALNEAGMEFQQIPGFQLSLIGQFARWLIKCENQDKKVVLLVDEYDAPLTAQLKNPKLFEKIRDYLRTFYSYIKSHKGAFRFVFVTGIARFQKASIFSEMNTFTDITLDPGYGTITGYTQEELEKYFSPYLDNAAKVLGMSRKELLDRMEEQYDGFCFDETAKYRLYAPWSVLKFLTSPENGFKNYWSETGGSPTLILDYFVEHGIKSPAEFDQEQKLSKSELSGLFTLKTINPLALLTQAGYFSIDRERGNYFYLRYPNGEVRETMAQRYSEIMCQKDHALANKIEEVVDAFYRSDANGLFEAFNAVILNIAHGVNFPLRDEEDVRGCLCLILMSQRIFVIGEKANAKGRSDIVAIDKENGLVLELKYCRDKTGDPEAKADELLQTAVGQIIEKKYGMEILGKKRLRMALVFSEEKRQFVRWQKVD